MATMAQCRLALDQCSYSLMQRPEVQGVGIVSKGPTENDFAVAIYVSEESADLPDALTVTTNGDSLEIPVEVEIQGIVQPE